MCRDRKKFLREYMEQAKKVEKEWFALMDLFDETEDICSGVKMVLLTQSIQPATAIDEFNQKILFSIKTLEHEGVQGLNDSELRKILEN